MFKRKHLMVTIMVIVGIVSAGVCASATSYSANSIDIISPQIGIESDVVLKKNDLYVNLCPKTSTPVYMLFYKISPDSILRKDPLVGKELDLDNYNKFSEGQKKSIKESLSARYNITHSAYLKSKKTYTDADIAVKKVFGDAKRMESIKKMSPYQQQVQTQYKKALDEYTKLKNSFSTVSTQYEQLFSNLVFGPAEIKPSSVAPYYKVVIPNVERGSYKMVFAVSKDGAAPFKTVRFNVTTSEEVVDEIIQTIPNTMDSIWSVPTE